mgnify:CR=1 FL=1
MAWLLRKKRGLVAQRARLGHTDPQVRSGDRWDRPGRWRRRAHPSRPELAELVEGGETGMLVPVDDGDLALAAGDLDPDDLGGEDRGVIDRLRGTHPTDDLARNALLEGRQVIHRAGPHGVA